MARWHFEQVVDLARPEGPRTWPDLMMVEGDQDAHQWRVEVLDGGQDASLAGYNAVAYFGRADGNTVVQQATITGNAVTVVMPQQAYAVPGPMVAAIRATANGQTITLAVGRCVVRKGPGDSYVDPGHIVPTLDELLAKIAAMEQATASANAAADNANQASDNANQAANGIQGEISALKSDIDGIPTKLKAKSNYVGNAISLYPIDKIQTRIYINDHPSQNETWTVKQYGKNMATCAQSANISANKNDTAYFSVDMPMEKGEAYTISYKQTGQVESAVHNRIRVDIGGTIYLSPNNLDEGLVVFTFVSPVTSTANVGLYTYSLSSDISVSEFQIEYGTEKTDYVSPVYKANTYNVTPTTEYVDILIEPFDGVNNIGLGTWAKLAVSCYENDIAIVNELNKEKIRWDIACGNIVCIGDSLTDGLYAPISKGKIKQNYPYYLGRLLNAEVDNIGKSGSYPSEVYNTIYPSKDFSKYDTAIIWLGTNGGLFNDFSDGSEADYYCKIIDGIKSQKSDIQFFICTVFVTGEINSGNPYASIKETNETIKVISERYSIPVIDFSDLTNSGARLLHNMQDNTHFGKSGNIYIANRIANFMQKYFEEDITRIEFGLLPKQ